jgi:hypothetical protein
MSSLKEMRDELRNLRKSHPEHMPVSKMRKADISSMIQKLKVGREESPSVGLGGSSGPKMFKSASESVKRAKAEEFPLEPHSDMPSKPSAMPKAKKEAPVAKKAMADKKAMVTEKGAVVVKPRGKKSE